MSKVDEIKAKMQKRVADTKEKNRRAFQEFFDHPLLFSALFISGVLSSLAGLALGLGIKIADGNVLIKTDLPHIFFAIIYAGLFPYFYEFGLANWLRKYLLREPDNRIQEITSVVMVAVTFLGTAITAFSAMDILVTSLGFFASFKEISPEVQGWVAFSLPGMLMLNIASGEIYRQSSEYSKIMRELEKDLRDKKLEADNEVRIARMEADKNIAIHASQEYTRRANEQTPRIGRDKGSDEWDRDATRHYIPTRQPVMNLNGADVERVDPTKPPRD